MKSSGSGRKGRLRRSFLNMSPVCQKFLCESKPCNAPEAVHTQSVHSNQKITLIF